jgi:hypothetical protein
MHGVGLGWRSSSERRWHSRLAIGLCCALLCLLSPQISRAQASESPSPDDLWTQLLTDSAALPNQIDSYAQDWTRQLNSLQASNDNLRSSNGQLQSSVDSLTQQTALLQDSLAASQAVLSTSEEQRSELQTQLERSIESLTQAQSDLSQARTAAEAEAARSKWAGVVIVALSILAGVSTGALALHLGGVW